MFEKLKQFKDLREKAKVIQTALADVKVEGEAAWGKVKVEMNGNQQVMGVTIHDELMKHEEKSKLESAVKDAVNDAMKKTQAKVMEKLKGVEGLDMPGLM